MAAVRCNQIALLLAGLVHGKADADPNCGAQGVVDCGVQIQYAWLGRASETGECDRFASSLGHDVYWMVPSMGGCGLVFDDVETCRSLGIEKPDTSCFSLTQTFPGCGAGFGHTCRLTTSPPPPSTITLQPCLQGDLPEHNVAAESAGGVPFGSASLAGHCSTTDEGQGLLPFRGIHCWQNINDGKLGNSFSWIPGTAYAFVGVVFAHPFEIHGIRVSRKGAGDCCDDRIGGIYLVEYTHELPAGLVTKQWLSAGSFTRMDYGFLFFKFSSPIIATSIRITVSDSQAAIDELEVYSASPRRLSAGIMV